MVENSLTHFKGGEAGSIALPAGCATMKMTKTCESIGCYGPLVGLKLKVLYLGPFTRLDSNGPEIGLIPWAI